MSKHVLVIGAVALGPKAASRFRRLDPEARITMIDQNTYISFGGCGIPFYVSGEINTMNELRSTNYGAIRDPQYFADFRNLDTRIQTRALSIDRKAKSVLVEDLTTGKQETLTYDELVIGTGSTANVPPIEGLELGNVTYVTSLDSAQNIREACAKGQITKAVIIGGGFIGLEMAVALADLWEVDTTLIEFMPQVMAGVLSPNLADMAAQDLKTSNVNVYTDEKVIRLEPDAKDPTKVGSVVTNKRTLEADLVILATGYRANSKLAKEAGLDIDPTTGGILVNEFMQTSDPNIYAGGDCVAVPHAITGKRVCLPLGSMANRQGRVIGTNLAGGKSKFEHVVGTWCVKLFNTSASGTGLTIAKAKAEGFDAVSVCIEHLDRAHFYPETTMMSLEIVVERETRRILGIQGICAAGDALKARIDLVAGMLQFGKPTIDDLSNAEIGYTPPFASAMDAINVVANVADNLLAGRLSVMEPDEFVALWEDRANNDVYFADARPTTSSRKITEKYPNDWHSTPLENIKEVLKTLPRDRPIALICNTGLRSADLMFAMKTEGFTNMRNCMGGMQALIKRGAEF